MADAKDVTIDVAGFRDLFYKDSSGVIHPKSDAVELDTVNGYVRNLLNSKSLDLQSKIKNQMYRVDVSTSDNPEGNSPVIGAGYRLFGDRPLKRKSARKANARGAKVFTASVPDPKVAKSLVQRADKIREYNTRVYNLALAMRKKAETPRDALIADVEIWQSLTGGGFDNNKMGDIARSVLNFVEQSKIEKYDEETGQVFVNECLKIGAELGKLIGYNSLEPVNFLRVRYEQDTDGQIAWPVFAAGKRELTQPLAKRIQFESGVDVSDLVGATVNDQYTGESREAQVQDGLSAALKRSILSPTKLHNMILYLARIQKHGFKLVDPPEGTSSNLITDDGKYLEAKDGKGRSIYPPEAMIGAASGMAGQAFQAAVQEAKWEKMPSLMKPHDARRTVAAHQRKARMNGYQVLPLDWSKYDARLKGWAMATALEYIVRPLFKDQYKHFIDLAMFEVCHKIMVVPDYSGLNDDDFDTLTKPTDAIKGLMLYPLTNGLISGIKWTHILGSLVNRALQGVIAHYLGYEYPIWAGIAAGDDTLLVIPNELVDLASAEKTYEPIERIAEDKLGMEINATKQIWFVVNDEVTAHFLQLLYHNDLGIEGVGSVTRALSSLFTAERDKSLEESEQLMAEISRMSNGFNNPFVEDGVQFWLEEEQVLLHLYHESGENAFELLVEASGGLDKVLQSASFSGREAISQYMEDKSGPMFDINSIAARVSSRLDPVHVDQGLLNRSLGTAITQ